MQLMPRIGAWCQGRHCDEVLRISAEEIRLVWDSRSLGTGILTLHEAGKLASVSLLVSGVDDVNSNREVAGPDEAMRFFRALAEHLPGDGLYVPHALRLVEMTRRPLLASVFWPPFTPTGDSWVRTLQRMVAYSFFRLHIAA